MRVAISYISEPLYDERRRDAHSLRCEFRRLVNDGVVRLRDYPEFVERADRWGLARAVVSYRFSLSHILDC